MWALRVPGAACHVPHCAACVWGLPPPNHSLGLFGAMGRDTWVPSCHTGQAPASQVPPPSWGRQWSPTLLPHLSPALGLPTLFGSIKMVFCRTGLVLVPYNAVCMTPTCTVPPSPGLPHGWAGRGQGHPCSPPCPHAGHSPMCPAHHYPRSPQPQPAGSAPSSCSSPQAQLPPAGTSRTRCPHQGIPGDRVPAASCPPQGLPTAGLSSSAGLNAATRAPAPEGCRLLRSLIPAYFSEV